MVTLTGAAFAVTTTEAVLGAEAAPLESVATTEMTAGADAGANAEGVKVSTVPLTVAVPLAVVAEKVMASASGSTADKV
jgi:hypothetical protein